MKKLSLCMTILLAVMLTFSLPAMAEKDMDFEVMSNGKVKVKDVEFKNMSEYFKSSYFKKKGGRCSTNHKHADYAKSFDTIMAASASDCSTSQTIINGEYWPTNHYTIPIVFHIIHKKDGTGNIPDSRIYNQVQVLNEDYRAMAGTLGAPGYDVKIQFELAGITRTANNSWFSDRGEKRYKSRLGWDQSRYLNVYVNSASGYLGYAYFPQSHAGSDLDGVVLLYSACGGRDEGSAPYNQGRTLVHEIGHYLGLYHTFQGGCSNGYTGGDLIADTNSEQTAHYECTQTYTCGTADPIHNYMDYTDDLCMYSFTAEQANRAVCALVNYRSSLYY